MSENGEGEREGGSNLHFISAFSCVFVKIIIIHLHSKHKQVHINVIIAISSYLSK